ncbi:MAG: hypothetical protein AVDCRST_MAG67-414, partial [uncultured Solirubrobacteraceae bacterium]
MAGDFAVAACQSDTENNSTTAFGEFKTRGMQFDRACAPNGDGERGLITANKPRHGGELKYRSRSVATISAPPGTVITHFRWVGHMGRDDCRWGVELFADLLSGKQLTIKRERRTKRELRAGRCRQQALFKPAATATRADAAEFNGVATRIVQRVICQGKPTCSSHGKNFIRTLKADWRIADVRAPSVTITPGTPLADGAWVSGEQPLGYDAHDNVGVRTATAVTTSKNASSDERTCAMATKEAFAMPELCPNGAGQITVNTRRSDEGTQQLVVRAQDTAGNLGDSAPVTARIDNYAPPQVPVTVEGGEHWRNRNDYALSWVNPPEGDRAPIVAATYKLCTAADGNCSQAERPGVGIA